MQKFIFYGKELWTFYLIDFLSILLLVPKSHETNSWKLNNVEVKALSFCQMNVTVSVETKTNQKYWNL